MAPRIQASRARKRPEAEADNQVQRFITNGSAAHPELPRLLTGWRWEEHGTKGALTLTSPDGAYTTDPYIGTTRPLEQAIAWQRQHWLRPPVPLDLQPDWVWQTDDYPSGAGVRLINLKEHWVTGWRAPAAAAECFGQAREILASHAPEGEAPRFIPGPDADGVYRRPPRLAEHGSYPPADLVDGRWQPREAYDAAALAELVESVTEHGVIAPLLVLVNEQGQLEIIGGHRRKRAATLAGLAAVPVKILEVTLPQAWELALIDNDQRADLTDVERGKAYERIIAEQGISEAELARRLGRPRAYIQQRRLLAQAVPALQLALAAGEVSFTQARGICLGSGGDHAAQQATLEKLRGEAKKYGTTMSGEEAQRHAEQAVLNAASDELKALGWQIAGFWQGSDSQRLFFAPTAKPARWSAAEMLAAVREQRRPPAEGGPVPLGEAARLDLLRVGWQLQNYADPWLIATRGKELILGDAGDAAAALDAARAQLTALHDRFVKAGWEITWNHTRLRATPPPPKKGKRPAPVELWDVKDAEKLLRQIEKGTWTPEEPRAASPGMTFTCARCGTKTTQYSFVGVERYCDATCAPIVRRELAAQQQALAAQVAAATDAWLAAAPPLALQLLAASRPDANLVARRRAAGGRASAEELHAEARLMLAEAAWRWHDDLVVMAALPAAVEAPATAVAAPAAGEPPWSPADVGQALDAIEERWAAGQVDAGDADSLLTLADLLDDMPGLGDDERAELVTRIGQLQARLDEEGVAQ